MHDKVQGKTQGSKWIWFAALLSLFAWIPLGQHYLEVGESAAKRPESSDFYKFYLSAQRLQQGYSMYWLVPPKLQRGDPCHRDTPSDQVHFAHPSPGPLNLGGDTPCLGPNLNPPIFMLIIQPLAKLPYEWAWWMWAALSMGSVVLSAWLLTVGVAEATYGRLMTAVWAALMLFAFYPTLANFTLGQVGAMMLLLLTLSWRSGVKGHHLSSGFWLGLVVGLKPFFLILLPLLLVTRKWRASLMVIGTGLSLSAMAAVIYGIDEYKNYMALGKNISWYGANWNGSWFGVFDRYFISRQEGDWPATLPWSRGCAILCATLTFVVCLELIRRQSRNSPAADWNAIMAMGLPMTLLVTPLGWSYYLPIAALSLLIAWRHIPDDAADRNTYRLALALPTTMAMVPITLKPSPTPMDPAQWYGLDAWYGYLTLLIWVCCTTCMLLRPDAKKGAEAPL
jgi:Glycosyltransferase family 87